MATWIAFLAGIVTALGADGQLFVLLCVGVDFYFAIAALRARGGRLVADRVLGADVVGYRAADGIDLVQRLGQEGDAAGLFAHDLQGSLGMAGVIFAFKNSDGVDGRAVFGLQAADSLLERLGTLVVIAVGYYEDDLLFQLGAILEVIRGGYYGVIERGASSGFDLFQARSQLVDARGEILIEVVFVVEINYADLVIGIGSAHQIERRGVYLFALFAHRSGVINDDTHGDRDVLVAKRRDGLLMSVFKDIEVAFVEVGYDVLLVVDDGGVQDYLFDLLFEYEDA